jgi:hypothetical protein
MKSPGIVQSKNTCRRSDLPFKTFSKNVIPAKRLWRNTKNFVSLPCPLLIKEGNYDNTCDAVSKRRGKWTFYEAIKVKEIIC